MYFTMFETVYRVMLHILFSLLFLLHFLLYSLYILCLMLLHVVQSECCTQYTDIMWPLWFWPMRSKSCPATTVAMCHFGRARDHIPSKLYSFYCPHLNIHKIPQSKVKYSVHVTIHHFVQHTPFRTHLKKLS